MFLVLIDNYKTMKKELQIILWILFFIIVFTVWKYWYDYYKYERNITIEEQEKRKIDEYNFEQLEKVKDVLRWKFKYKIRNLSEFNKKYDQNITPIKNCYFLWDRNWYLEEGEWWWGYIFWFELYSDKYIEKYCNSIRRWSKLCIKYYGKYK
jgi:hypothetical protein